MPAFFTSNPHGQAGEGIINVPEITCKNTPQFAIYRASDGLCLSPEGWQSAEVFHTASNWDNDSANLRIAVDSSIVDQLDALDTYKFILKYDDEKTQTLSLVIKDIVYSSLNGGQGIISNTPSPEPEPVVETIPEPEPEVETIPEPVENTPPLAMPEPEKKTPIAIIIASLLLLLLLGAGLWWFLTQNKQIEESLTPNTETSETAQETPEGEEQSATEAAEQTTPESEAQPDAPNADSTNEDAKNQDTQSQNAAEQAKNTEDAAKETSPNTQAPSTPSTSPMQQVREFLRQNSSGQNGLTLATKLKQELGEKPSAENMDALFLILEDAAQKDVPKAMLEVAKYYDPSNQAPKGSIIPDANEAYAWYIKARDAGEADANASLENLKTWAQDAANSGNTTAIDLLKHWK